MSDPLPGYVLKQGSFYYAALKSNGWAWWVARQATAARFPTAAAIREFVRERASSSSSSIELNLVRPVKLVPRKPAASPATPHDQSPNLIQKAPKS